MRRLLLIGLDAGDDRIITSILKTGKLNNFRTLIEQGCYGKLRSTIPAITIPAWPAMFSGKNAGKLGAVGFSRLERDHSLTLFTSGYWKRDMLWSILGKNSIKCGLINVPGTNPVYPINGFMISSDFGTFQIYPDNLKISLDILPLEKFVSNTRRLKAAKENFIKRAEAARELMKRQDWQLFVWVIRIADIAMHLGRMNDVEESYILIDKYIGPILQIARENSCNIFVASDHGLRKVKKNFNVNTFFEKIGYLKFEKEARYLKIAKKLMGLGLKPLLMLGYRFLNKFGDKFSNLDPEALSVDIKWDKTKAFTLTDTTSNFMGVWLNTKKHFAQGTIDSKKEEESIKETLINKLIQFEDGQMPVVRKIWRKEELYPNTSQYIPDLFIETEEGYAPDFRAYDEVITSNDKYIHDPYGIFIACGPDIKILEEKLQNLEIIDIAPTILHIFNVPIPSDVDGKVIKEIFKPTSEILTRKVQYKKSSKKEKTPLMSEEEKIIKKRLKTLGYIG